MSQKNSGSSILFIIVVSLMIGVLGGLVWAKVMRKTPVYEKNSGDKLTYTLNLLEREYVDNISRDSLAEWVLPFLLKRLDPHSEYIPAEIFTQVNEPLTGQFDGIGVMFNMFTDTALISNVIPGGPSDKAGVVAGDKIITVNDSIVAGIKLDSDKLVKKLRGKRDTKVTIGVQRHGSKDLTHIEITRGIIPMKSLDAEFLVDESVGFIKFSRFARNTFNELMAAMARLTDQGAKSFVIDMRGNVGGYLDQAIIIANEFLEKGQLIVYTEGAHSPRREQYADGKGIYKNVPLTIIIDEYSASASEILAGAIQDNDRGVIVGRRSFGKGLVQEQIDYKDGSAARITISRYYTPAGRSIQKPYKLGESEEYYMELLQRAKHNELFNVDSIKMNEKLRYETPKGKVVYGGGGIMPDEFVPMDTTDVSNYFRKIFEKNLIFRFSIKMTEDNRAEINNIKTFSDLDAFFAKRNIYNDFVQFAANNGVAPDARAEKSLITAQVKGYIGRNTLLEDSAFYYYYYAEDQTAMKAISTLQK